MKIFGLPNLASLIPLVLADERKLGEQKEQTKGSSPPIHVPKTILILCSSACRATVLHRSRFPEVVNHFLSYGETHFNLHSHNVSFNVHLEMMLAYSVQSTALLVPSKKCLLPPCKTYIAKKTQSTLHRRHVHASATKASKASVYSGQVITRAFVLSCSGCTSASPHTHTQTHTHTHKRYHRGRR